jgi:hypothetical protein
MSVNLANAFNTLLNLHFRNVTIQRSGSDGVVSGIVPATSVTLTSNISTGSAWIDGVRVEIPVTAKTYTALKDTYIDISSLGVITYVEVANGAGIPAVTTDNLRISKVVTSLTAITSVTSLSSIVHNNSYNIGPLNIKWTPSNFFRNLSGPEEVTIEGEEYVISKKVLESVYFPVPRKGDRIIDSENGVSVISESRPMYGLGGAIIGYRVRTS